MFMKPETCLLNIDSRLSTETTCVVLHVYVDTLKELTHQLSEHQHAHHDYMPKMPEIAYSVDRGTYRLTHACVQQQVRRNYICFDLDYGAVSSKAQMHV